MIIHLISCPRTISTALMYSFAQRDDTKVFDEPFYATYLAQTGLEHPGAELILKSQPKTELEVIRNIEEESLAKHVFIKNMASHFKVLQPEHTKNYQTVFLIRDPLRIITSYSKVIKVPTEQDIGVPRQAELFRWYLRNGNFTPIVIDSNDVLQAPERHLLALCLKLQLEFVPAMLNWPSGAKSYDGVWAPYWYDNVHRSTGFAKQVLSTSSLPPAFNDLYQQCKKDYDFLYQYSLTNQDHVTEI